MVMDDSGSAIGGHELGGWLCPAGVHSWGRGRFGASQEACLLCFRKELGETGAPPHPAHASFPQCCLRSSRASLTDCLSVSTRVLVPGDAKAH